MKNYTMFYFDYLFGDHFEKVSAKAKLLYINLNFYANAGFVANPRKVCKEMGFNLSTLDELISIEELLTLEGRDEMFITSYFVHNPNFNPLNWTKTPYATYWRGKLWMKKNRVATFSKKNAELSMNEGSEYTVNLTVDPTLPNSAKERNPLDQLVEAMKKVERANEAEKQKLEERKKNDKRIYVGGYKD